jgi:hypothetical protein
MVENNHGFEPTFENGGFWEYYRDLEKQFEEFLGFVPYLPGNEGTYAFRLANLILGIGAYVDSALKEIAKSLDFQTKYPKMLNPENKHGKTRNHVITDFYPISDDYRLPKQTVLFKCLPNKESIVPFENYTIGNTPYWWTAYNNIKHNFNQNFKEAKLKTVRDALAGAFLLNVVHEPSALRLFSYGLLKPKYLPVVMWEERYDKFRGREQHRQRPKWEPIDDAFTIETSLFQYDYEKAKNLKSSS